MHIQDVHVLKPNHAAVWYCTFTKQKEQLPDYFEILSADEKARAGRFKFEKDRFCYIISRGTLRVLLSTYLNKKPENIHFLYNAHGKPYLAGTGLKFNVSHSADMAVFAFFEGNEVGVDIEYIKNDFNVLELAQNFFSVREIASLEKQPEVSLGDSFFRCWTRKEAFIKADGSGLSFPLDQFSVSLHSDDEAELHETKWNIDEKFQWSLFSFKPADKYIGALAIRAQKANVSYHNLDAKVD